MYEVRLREALPRVEERISNARARAGREQPVTLVAVTKGHPVDAVRAAAAAGIRICGENRVQELEAKRAELGSLVEWHLIGHLQRNKVRRALPLFELIHSVDSLRLAEALSHEAERADREVSVLVQVNASGEAAKGGFDVREGIDPVAAVAALPRLRVLGLMTMAPLTDDEATLRRTFRITRALFDRCAAEVTGFEPRHLSMGMSNDFEIAVEEGSTMVRLGTVLFGERLSMIDLTPLEVRKKKGDFRRQLRGYDPAQVDDFLDLVADRLESLVRENLSVTERIARLEQQVADYRDRERALTEALVTAQEMREEIRSQTVREVELAKRQAQQDAERIRAEAIQERHREEDNLRRLRMRQRQLLQSFRTFLEREISELVVFSKALEMEDQTLPGEDLPGRSARPGQATPPGGAGAPAEPGPVQPGAAAGAAAAALAFEAPPAPTPVTPYVPPPAEASAPTPPAASESKAATPVDAPPPEMDALARLESGELDPFGELLPEPSARSTLEEPAARVQGGESAATGPGEQKGLGPVTEEDLGALLSSWTEEVAEPEDASAAAAGADDVPSDQGAADELDELMLSEAELYLSDADVLEDPSTAGAEDELARLESVEPVEGEEWAFEESLLMEEQEPPEGGSQPGDQPVDLSLLPDDNASLNLDDLGLPPLERTAPDDVEFGLTLRPLPEDESSDSPQERSGDDDDDMFSTLFGKPR